MRVGLVINAASGRGVDGERVVALLRDAGATVAVHSFDPSGRDDAVDEAARAAAAEGPDRVVVAGGDGSIGPVAAVAVEDDLPVAVIPTGTANDFARALDIPRDIEEAARLAAGPGRERDIDLLWAGERPFLNAASLGLSVLAAREARPLKRPLGALAYAVGALRAGVRAGPMRCRVTVDGAQVYVGSAWQVIVAGTGAFGGGSELGEVDTDDRRVDVAVVEASPRVALLRRAYGMRTGTLADQPGVHDARGRVVELELPERAPFNVDGEVCAVSPTRFRADDRGVRVVVP